MIQRRIETNHEGRIVYATPEAATVLGTKPRELVGRTLGEVLPKHRAAVNAHLRDAVQGRAALVTRIPILHRTGGTVVFCLTAAPLDARRVEWRLTDADVQAEPGNHGNRERRTTTSKKR